ncbi:right-handed parallel beta-helix repeat-containing protein [Algoriphagus sp. H41]|uniref:Right-handed parallel beta-helix repeat-containing protein n=1 Tax=Algoriphagus oliviformis TaxID=2811231 RepID=A0ABS3C5T2_9BACT|nr:right-handed parallel beta-helix repeat-containing protein [Algoriphagus oliviformis]MBN7812483.1 right-handed parallel beta-helix repeat-containing protein [Algoriphagus oliviformis]
MFFLSAAFLTGALSATELHVAKTGKDNQPGTREFPLLTIQAAAALAQPGDEIVVHEGIYRERINPPRGGTSESSRIIYRAAAGEKVSIKGSELVSGWEKAEDGVWTVVLPNTFFGDFNPFDDVLWGDWFYNQGRLHHTGAVYLNGHWLREAETKADVFTSGEEKPAWFAIVDGKETRIWAQFGDRNPNEELVEVNARQSVFYPEKPGIDYITVRGFTLEQAASPWSPPTAEQIGLIGTHWSKGWIVEDNTIQYASAVGLTLGKHGDEWDNRAATAYGYTQTIDRALQQGWSRENIGGHRIRKNHILHCGQAAIVGSMGGAFSQITENEIHDIYLDWPFGGLEMAAIKLHGPIDTEISHNHIYRTGAYGIWLDWMSQGTHVSGNLMHDNSFDLFVEVNHGPFVVDHNLFLSELALRESSGGGAYVHNLFAGEIRRRAERVRETPYHRPHSTEIIALSKVIGDDERFYNNLLVGSKGLVVFEEEAENLQAAGNVYLGGAIPSRYERDALVLEDGQSRLSLEKRPDGWWLCMKLDSQSVNKAKTFPIGTSTLGESMVSKARFENPDGSALELGLDYFKNTRNSKSPSAGPFTLKKEKNLELRVWPK